MSTASSSSQSDTPPSPEVAFHQNRLLFGYDPTPGIVAVELGSPGTVKVWRRQEDRLLVEEEPFHPLAWVTTTDLLGAGPPPLETRELQGEGIFRYLATYPDVKAQGDARRAFQKASGESPGSADAPYRVLSDPLHQYLLASGRTSFKGMAFTDLVRMQLDVIACCPQGYEFPDAQRADDTIVAVGVAASSGFETVLRADEMGGEKALLARLVDIVREQDPDVIEGHDVYRFTLEYVKARAARHGVRLTWGRDGSPVTRRASRVQIAEKTIDYPRFDVAGRHVVDTWLLAQYYDISSRSLPSFDLGDVARHTGARQASGESTIPAPRLLWDPAHDPDHLRRTLLDNLRDIRAVSDLLLPIYFLQAQIFPYPFQSVIVRGNATRIDSLFMREYLRRSVALPGIATAPFGYEGGYADIFEQGIVGPVLAVDVQSLYPSLMLSYAIKPMGDELDIFLDLLRVLTEFRVRAKDMARRSEDLAARSFYSALQTTFKILINSFYGYLGTSFCHFSDSGAASEVTRRGRELIHSVLDWLRAHGHKPVELDTDGVYFIPQWELAAGPNTHQLPAHEEAQREQEMLADVSTILPPGIRLELGGRYPSMFSYKTKNYALLDESGQVVIKGSGLRSRGMEKYLRDFLEEMLALALAGRAHEAEPLLQGRLDDIAAHRLHVLDLCKTETLSEALEAYRKKVSDKKRNPSAAYELACASGRPYKAGDTVSYYVAGRGRKVKVYEASRPVSAWSATAPDENVEYYQQKLVEFARKFQESFKTPQP